MEKEKKMFGRILGVISEETLGYCSEYIEALATGDDLSAATEVWQRVRLIADVNQWDCFYDVCGSMENLKKEFGGGFGAALIWSDLNESIMIQKWEFKTPEEIYCNIREAAEYEKKGFRLGC